MTLEIKNKSEKTTPLMTQYKEIKNKYPDIILFFRLGDFYEMFYEDAQIASSILNITLTKRGGIPMCGIPYHSRESYLLRLMKAGQKVAICEQLETPTKGKKIVLRDVVRVITPGTVVEDNYLDESTNNYLAGIYPSNDDELKLVLVFIDVSTGDFFASVLEGINIETNMLRELSKFSPKEIILLDEFKDDKKLLNLLRIRNFPVSFIDSSYKEDTSLVNLNLKTLGNLKKSLNIKSSNLNVNQENNFRIISANDFLYRGCVCCLNYLFYNHKDALKQVKDMEYFDSNEFLSLNENTLEHLEITENFHTKKRKDTLLDIIDNTVTPMGSRLMRRWLLTPLINPIEIKKRQSIVKYFCNSNNIRNEIRAKLKPINDIERLINRINCNANSLKDLIHLKNTLNIIPEINRLITSNKSDLTDLSKFDTIKEFTHLKDIIDAAINDNPPNNLKDGNLIKDGFNSKLDEIKELKKQGRNWLKSFEEQERNNTGIQKLKVGYNNVFGYYIEVTKANKDKVPENFVRIQTLVNNERYTTEVLKTYETKLITAQNEIIEIETRLYNEICGIIRQELKDLQVMVSNLALLDVYSNLAHIAIKRDYICPEVHDGYDVLIKDGRHPVVDACLTDVKFVPNDTKFSLDDLSLYIITGPNMAGKSTYIRQVALIVIMAQIGSFVPAESARIGVVDKIYTRIGASDRLSRGESTFMVEMKETASIIKGATSKSLVILDEVGRGTSTFDGISLAWAIVHELVTREWYNDTVPPRTLFATHYFELTELASLFKQIKNYNMAVKDINEKIVFLYKLVEGCADGSYGIHVAGIAGVPLPIIMKAKTKLHELETNAVNDVSRYKKQDNQNRQIEFFDEKNKVLEEIKSFDIDNLSPMEALLKIKEWQNKV